jgi:hypothetical protein
VLFSSYDSNDLRKQLFFKKNVDNTYGFKGSYNGTGARGEARNFSGITTDEMYLIRAECFARAQNKDSAMSYLNTLMQNRWRNTSWSPITASDSQDALNKVLNERRRELVWRCIRWSDLRRFNLENANITLTRIVNGTVYTLPPNDLRWVMLIPWEVINTTNIQQNPR